MTKIKKTMWSKMFSVIIGFALVFSVLFGGVALTNKANAADAYTGKDFNYDLWDYTYQEENNEFIDKTTGLYVTSILDEDGRVATLLNARERYNELSPTDKTHETVVVSKAALDKIWADVFAKPHALIDEMNTTLSAINTAGVKYSDGVTIGGVDGGLVVIEKKLFSETDLDKSQQNYVMYVRNNQHLPEGENIAENREEYQLYLDLVAKHAELVKELDQLALDIDALGSKIGKVVYSDKATILDVNARYEALEASAKEYVDAKCEETNVATTVNEFNALVAKYVKQVDVDLQAMIDRGIVYGDKTTINNYQADYNLLDSEDAAKVTDAKNLDEAHAAIQKIIDDIVYNIDVDLQAMIDRGVELSDETEINRINNLYLSFDPEDKAYVENAEKDSTGCQDFANLKEALDLLDDLLAQLARDIDTKLEGLTAENLDYSEKAETIKSIVAFYGSLDPDDQAEVQKLCSDFANYNEANTALQGYLDNLAKVIDEEFGAMLAEGVEYSDKARINEIAALVEELDTEDKAYVESCPNFSNLAKVEEALQAIIDGLVEDIDSDLQVMLDRGVELSDADEINRINNLYTQFDATDKAYVENAEKDATGCQDFANLAEALAALKKVEDAVAKVIEEIDVELEKMINEGIDYSDKTRINEINDDYKALSPESQKFVENAEKDETGCQDFANLAEALGKLNQILQDNADDIDDDLQAILDKGVELSDADTINGINDTYNSFDSEDQTKIKDELCDDFANLKEALDALAALENTIEDVIDEIDNELEKMINEGIDYSDKDRIEEIKKHYDDLSDESKTYVENAEKDETGCQDFDNLKEALDALKAIQDNIDKANEYLAKLAELLSTGIKYSYKTEFDSIMKMYEELDDTAKAEVQKSPNYANVAVVKTALETIEARATNAQNVIAQILYYKDGAMVADVTGEIVVASGESVDLATTALAAIYDGSENIATLTYKWEEVEVTALATFIPDLAKYDTAVAKIAEFKAQAKLVADDITAIETSETNHYKVLENTINDVYADFVALNNEDYNGLHNLQNYVEVELQEKINNLKVELDKANAWILKVALLIDSKATAETADEIIAGATPEKISELVNFDVNALKVVEDDYKTLIGDVEEGNSEMVTTAIDVVMQASVADAYNVLKALRARIDEIRNNLIEDMEGIIERGQDGKENFQEGDYDLSEEIKDIYEKLDDSQIDDELEDTYNEFFEIAEKLLFVKYFEQAVAELYVEHQNEYYTVEGYVLEKSLLALYHTLSQSYQDLIHDEVIDNLHEIDETYKEKAADLLDYNKIKAEMEELVNTELANINSSFDTLEADLTKKVNDLLAEVESLQKELTDNVNKAIADIEDKFDAAKAEIVADVEKSITDMETLVNELKTRVEEVETELTSEIQAEIAGLKNTLEGQITTSKSNLEAEIKKLQDADKVLDKKIDDEIASLKKMVMIGGAVLAGVSVILLIWVIVLSAKVGKLKSNAGKKEDEEDDEDEPEEEVDEEENED